MKNLNFTVPFSGFASTTFINCFTSLYMYIEGYESNNEGITKCNQWNNGKCNSCGNCATKPQAVQERFFFLFDTVCGHSSLRCRFDGKPTEMQILINGSQSKECDFYDGGGSGNIEFLFGFAGYSFNTVADKTVFKDEIIKSINANKPVIVKLSNNAVPYAVISGFDGNTLLCPDFKAAQKSPEPKVTYDNITEIYVVIDKIEPKYTLADALRRIEMVCEYNLKEGLWDDYMQQFTMYNTFGNATPEEKKARMMRLAETMWHTFNCHNFAEVFRAHEPARKTGTVYDNVSDMKKLGSQEFISLIDKISRSCGYTHDLAWSLIGLNDFIKTDDWKAGFYGEMIELVIWRIKENDKDVLECVRNIINLL